MDTDSSFISFSREEVEEVHKARAVETIQQPTTDKTLEQLKEEINAGLQGAAYREELIRSILRKQAGLRKCYLILVLNSPARVNTLKEKTFGARQTIYNLLYNMINLGLVKKVSIMEALLSKKPTPEQKEVITKFNDWTSKMNEGMKQYYTAKTNYFTLTELGKKPVIVEWALKCEKELRAVSEEVTE